MGTAVTYGAVDRSRFVGRPAEVKHDCDLRTMCDTLEDDMSKVTALLPALSAVPTDVVVPARLFKLLHGALDETKDTLTHQRIYEAIEHLSQPSQKRMEASVDEQEDEMGASVFTEGPLGGPSKRARVA